MIEYQLVETATMFPQMCNCGSVKGPFIDTNIMINERRWYICKLCVKRSARPFGFMPGKKMDELEQVSETIEAKDRELAVAHERNERQTAKNAEMSRRVEEQGALIEHYKGIVDQQRHLAGLIAESTRELVATANGSN